ncbi:hypothetical protein VII00023_13942, partial [Vibrio ichthyoenteri ATCC 700023]
LLLLLLLFESRLFFAFLLLATAFAFLFLASQFSIPFLSNKTKVSLKRQSVSFDGLYLPPLFPLLDCLFMMAYKLFQSLAIESAR